MTTPEPDMPISNELVMQQYFILIGRLDNISVQLNAMAQQMGRMEEKLDRHIRDDH